MSNLAQATTNVLLHSFTARQVSIGLQQCTAQSLSWSLNPTYSSSWYLFWWTLSLRAQVCLLPAQHSSCWCRKSHEQTTMALHPCSWSESSLPSRGCRSHECVVQIETQTKYLILTCFASPHCLCIYQFFSTTLQPTCKLVRSPLEHCKLLVVISPQVLIFTTLSVLSLFFWRVSLPSPTSTSHTLQSTDQKIASLSLLFPIEFSQRDKSQMWKVIKA